MQPSPWQSVRVLLGQVPSGNICTFQRSRCSLTRVPTLTLSPCVDLVNTLLPQPLDAVLGLDLWLASKYEASFLLDMTNKVQSSCLRMLVA